MHDYHRNLCRSDKYPRHLLVDFRKLKPAPLRRYCEQYDIPVRPDAPVGDVAVAVGRHFEVHLDVLDEDEVLARFLNAVSHHGCWICSAPRPRPPRAASCA